jgi:NADPH-dependent ferric siderophore reductase
LNIVAHGIHGPGAEWAASTRPGDRVNGVGPRGKIYLDPGADWHVFLGDETAVPGYLAMLESVPDQASGVAYLSVDSADDEMPTSASGRRSVKWLHRDGAPPTDSTLLEATARDMELPPGRGHVYVAGEVQVVAAIQRALLARGLQMEQISPKAYWGRAKANANNGEPERES